jgi:hypothetical protein
VITTAKLVFNVIKDMDSHAYRADELEGNRLALEAESLGTKNPRSPIEWCCNLWAWAEGVWCGFWYGRTKVDPKLTYIQDQWDYLTALTSADAVEKAAFARLSYNRGDTYFLREFNMWLYDEKLRYHIAIEWAKTDYQYIDPDYLALDNALYHEVTGK